MKVAKRVEKLNKIRKDGLTPGVLVGKDIESTPIQVDAKEVLQAYRTYGNSRTFKIKLGRQVHNVYFKEVQMLILRPNEVIHFSLQKVSATDTITASIPIILTNTHEVESQGLVIQHIMQSMEVEFLATVVIDNIEVDVSHLKAGDAIYVKDMKLPENVSTKVDEEEMVANAVYPRVSEESSEESASDDTSVAEEKSE